MRRSCVLRRLGRFAAPCCWVAVRASSRFIHRHGSTVVEFAVDLDD